MTELTQVWPLLPEIVLALGAMALLMLGAFERESDWHAETVGWLSVLTLAMSAFLLAAQSPAPATLFDGALVLDGFARFFKFLILAGSAAALVMGFGALREGKIMKFEVPVLVLLATLGMLLMVSAGDLIALYLGLEMQSLALYVLAAIRRDDVRSSEAGLKYFVLGALSSGMLLYGASLVYGVTGATGFAAIAEFAKAQGSAENLGLIVGLVFLLVGLAFKISAVPFHMWTPDVYEGSPTPVTAFFASAPKLAAMGLLVRVLAGAFPGVAPAWQQIVVFLSLASMLLGAFAAIGQTNFKRLMAYSSIGNVGFALVGLAAGGEDGIAGVLVYMALYLIMTIGVFACLLAMRREAGPVEDIAELAGLARNNLPMAFALAMLLFSLAGIPPLAGFFAKLSVFSAAVKAGLWPLAVIGVLASVVSAFYYLRIIKIMFMDSPAAAFRPLDGAVGTVMAVATVLILLYTVFPSMLVDAAAAAARSFHF